MAIMHMMRKGQIKRFDGRDTMGQAKFVESLFRIAAWLKADPVSSRLKLYFATEPYSNLAA
jgi:hypothetical protein